MVVELLTDWRYGMIDLKNSYVKTSDKESLEALLNECCKQDIEWISGLSPFGFAPSLDYVGVSDGMELWQSTIKDGYKQITLADLKPKRTKTEYVKCEFDHKWEAVKWIEESDLDCLYWLSGTDNLDHDAFISAMTPAQVVKHMAKGKELYRKVEREVSWQDEVKAFIDENAIGNDYISVCNGEVTADYVTTEDIFIAMCHLVASMTDKPE